MSQNSLNNKEEPSALTLSKLTARIRKTLNTGFPETLWVIAEISDLHQNSSGHVYLELIEKDPHTNRILARMRATIWSFTYRMLRPYFEGSTGYQLSSGIKVLVNVSLEFHPQYSISLNIKDIDPSYTLGDLARKKAEIIERLTREGVIEMNKQLDFPIVPQRIAVISSPTAAGLEDFLNTLSTNILNFKFGVSLFQAVMQGEKAEESIIKCLEKIFESEDKFDVVVIIRGGGASIELECFNNYDLAFHIAQFPIPVLTGIGHERDETVADIVAHKKLKTPTAVAEMLIDRMTEFLSGLQQLEEYISDLIKEKILIEKDRIALLSRNLFLFTREKLHKAENNLSKKSYTLKAALRSILGESRNFLREKKNILKIRISALLVKEHKDIEGLAEKVNRTTRQRLKEEKDKLSSCQRNAELSNPQYILSKGYSITKHGGKVLKNAKAVKKDEEIITILYKGKLKSKIR
ncbi:MAG: exodeoxyribonuclease VII large subunit [Bacteroidota bacterium]